MSYGQKNRIVFFRFKPLLMYVILAITFMVLIIEGLAATEEGFSKPSTKKVTCTDAYDVVQKDTVVPTFKVVRTHYCAYCCIPYYW